MQNNNNNTNTIVSTNKKSNARDKNWLRNPNQRKTEKEFSVRVRQNRDGSFTMLGNHSKVKMRKNQYISEWQHVDTRDLAREIRSNGVRSL
jgi:hypothetical protein